MISRRSFLKALPLCPLARSLGETIRLSESGESPLRFVFFVVGNGIRPHEIQPPEIALPFEPGKFEERGLAGLKLPDVLSPLDSFRESMAIVQGLSGRVVGPPPHSADFGALGCFPQRKRVYGETIDGALAKKLGGVFPHVGLGISDWEDSKVIYNVSAWEAGKPLPTICQPRFAYERFFSRLAGAEAKQQFEAKTNVLDFLACDVKRLEREPNSAEKEKLDHYLSALEEMSERQGKLVEAGGRVGALDVSEFPDGEGGFPQLEVQLQIAESVLISGLSQVVTISSGSGLGFQGIRVDGRELGFAPGEIDLHGVGHGTGFCGKSSQELHAALLKRHVQALSGFIKRLSETPEGEGSMLDRTCVVMLSDQANGHHPSCFEWPVVLLGGLAGKLRTQERYVHYPWYGRPGHRTLAQLYATLLEAAGEGRKRFGMRDSSLKDVEQDEPLAELLS